MTAVLRHEHSSYFTNVTGYVFGAFLLLFAGIYTMVINLQSASPYFEYVLMNMDFIFLIIVPILTMPGDDISHPIPDLTGYITEGQIVLDRGMDATGLYPPVSVLPSLSRLMKDGIGAGYTREDHVTLSNQLFACYAKVQDAKALASVIGEEELSQSDKQLMAFGRAFEQEFIGQGNTDRTMEQTLDLGWELLAILPRNALDRCDAATLDKYYEPAKARISKANNK